MEQGIKHKEGKNSLELDWTFIRHLGERMDAHKGKYPPYNWKNPMEDPIELVTAIMRHAIAIQEGELEDDGREFGHIEGIACGAMMFFAQMVLKKKENFEQEFIKQMSDAQYLVFSNDPTGKDEIEWSHPKTGYCNQEERLGLDKQEEKEVAYFKINGDQKISDFMEMFGTIREESDGTTRFEMSDIKIIKTSDGFLLNNTTE